MFTKPLEPSSAVDGANPAFGRAIWGWTSRISTIKSVWVLFLGPLMYICYIGIEWGSDFEATAISIPVVKGLA